MKGYTLQICGEPPPFGGILCTANTSQGGDGGGNGPPRLSLSLNYSNTLTAPASAIKVVLQLNKSLKSESIFFICICSPLQNIFSYFRGIFCTIST